MIRRSLLLLLLASGACTEETSSSQALQQITAPAQEIAQHVRTMRPKITRSGSIRFIDKHLDLPAAAEALMARLSRTGESEEIRAALATALARTGGDYATASIALLKSESSQAVRQALIGAIARVEDEGQALEGLKLGMEDKSAAVRAFAANAIGHHGSGLALQQLLTKGLSDRDLSVRIKSARALGILAATDAFDATRALVTDRSAELRLESLRALGRMDKARAATLAELDTLLHDSDARVRLAASKVRARAY